MYGVYLDVSELFNLNDVPVGISESTKSPAEIA